MNYRTMLDQKIPDRCNVSGIAAKEMQLFNHNYFIKGQTRNGQMNFALAIGIANLPAKWLQQQFLPFRNV